MKKLVSLLLVLAMMLTVLVGCGSTGTTSTTEAPKTTNAPANNPPADDKANTPVEQGKVVNIYTWNEEFIDRYNAYAADLADKHGVTVNFVTVANENNAYQNNLDAALMGQADAAADDKVDIFLVEADYASKYTKTDFTLDVYG